MPFPLAVDEGSHLHLNLQTRNHNLLLEGGHRQAAGQMMEIPLWGLHVQSDNVSDGMMFARGIFILGFDHLPSGCRVFWWQEQYGFVGEEKQNRDYVLVSKSEMPLDWRINIALQLDWTSGRWHTTARHSGNRLHTSCHIFILPFKKKRFGPLHSSLVSCGSLDGRINSSCHKFPNNSIKSKNNLRNTNEIRKE